MIYEESLDFTLLNLWSNFVVSSNLILSFLFLNLSIKFDTNSSPFDRFNISKHRRYILIKKVKIIFQTFFPFSFSIFQLFNFILCSKS